MIECNICWNKKDDNLFEYLTCCKNYICKECKLKLQTPSCPYCRHSNEPSPAPLSSSYTLPSNFQFHSISRNSSADDLYTTQRWYSRRRNEMNHENNSSLNSEEQIELQRREIRRQRRELKREIKQEVEEYKKSKS